MNLSTTHDVCRFNVRKRMKIQDLIERGEKLPTIAHVAQRVIDSLNAEETSIGEIGTLISADPVLGAQLLRLANSAYFKLERHIETVDNAMRVLGLAMVRNLVLGSCFRGAFAKTPGLDLPLFWLHSLYTASTARWLAGQLHVNQDLTFTLGLMQGIGQLQMHMAAPSAMTAIDQECPPIAAERAALENAAFGFCYLDVSAAMARLWNFPASLSEPMAMIRDPLAAPELSVPAGLVHLGAWLARVEVQSQDLAAAGYPEALSVRLGLAGTPPQLPPLTELCHGLEAMLS